MTTPTYWVCTYCMTPWGKSCVLVYQWDDQPIECIDRRGPTASWTKISRDEFLRHDNRLNDPYYTKFR